MVKKNIKSNNFGKTERIYKDIQFFFEMKINEVLDKRFWDIPTMEMNDNILDAFAILCTNDHVWVIENQKNKKLVGVITEHDILNSIQPPKASLFFWCRIT